MIRGLTASFLVCVAAAGLAVGALILHPGSEPEHSVSLTDTAPPPQSPYGGGGDGAGGGTDAPTATATLEISDFEFSDVSVAPGATVTVVNQDDFPHTVTDADGAFSSGPVDGGGTGSFVAPSTPGTYEIHCNFHPQMSGTLTVLGGN
jgi:plastocyanin